MQFDTGYRPFASPLLYFTEKWNRKCPEVCTVERSSTGLRTGLTGVRFPAELRTLPFSNMSTLTMWQIQSTHTHTQWVPWFSPWEQSGRGVKLTAHLHLASRQRASGTIPLSPCMIHGHHRVDVTFHLRVPVSPFNAQLTANSPGNQYRLVPH